MNKEVIVMTKDELQEVKELHFKIIKRICQKYVDNEFYYKTTNGDTRISEVCCLIRGLTSEKERINELTNLMIKK